MISHQALLIGMIGGSENRKLPSWSECQAKGQPAHSLAANQVGHERPAFPLSRLLLSFFSPVNSALPGIRAQNIGLSSLDYR